VGAPYGAEHYHWGASNLGAPYGGAPYSVAPYGKAPNDVTPYGGAPYPGALYGVAPNGELHIPEHLMVEKCSVEPNFLELLMVELLTL